MLNISKWSATLMAMFCLGVSGLQAQAPAPAPAQAPASTPVPSPSANAQPMEKRIKYVRRFSLGAGLSVMVFDTLNNGTLSRSVISPPTVGNYATTVQRYRVGYGGIGQVLITNRFAATVGFFMRRVAYTRQGEVFSGVDSPLTAADERRFATVFEDTRARFYDIPVTVRFFGKDREKAGGRWFVEAGGVMRKVSNVKSSVVTVLGTEEPTCCKPTVPSQNVRGVVAGFGGQLIDQFGIRVMPSVRFTRWLGESFNSFSTISKRNQIEAIITIGF